MPYKNFLVFARALDRMNNECGKQPVPAPEPYRVVADVAYGFAAPKRYIQSDETMMALRAELRAHGLTIQHHPRYLTKPWCLYDRTGPLSRGTLEHVCRHAVRSAQRQRNPGG